MKIAEYTSQITAPNIDSVEYVLSQDEENGQYIWSLNEIVSAELNDLIKNTPNDTDLGRKIREKYGLWKEQLGK